MNSRYQVIIVGGGPVGMALAVELGQRGVSCAVVERRHDVAHIPKGQNLTQRTLEHFYFWGCVDELRAKRLLPRDYPIGGLTAYRSLMNEYWYAPPGLEQVRSYYFQENERLPQFLTEEVLRSRVKQLSSPTCLFGWTAQSLDQDHDTVRVTIYSDAEPTTQQVLEADFVVGCDGAHSLIREQLGIDRDGPNFNQQMVLTVFRSPELHEALNRFPERTTYRVLKPELHGIWQFFGRVDLGETWFFHGPVPKETTADDVEYLREVLEDAAGFRFALDFEYIGFWELRVEAAATYRNGNAFIAGDAAHSHPPYGGFGLNMGFEDVANLGWKLAAVLQGWGGDALLNSYSEERRPVFVETGNAIIAGGMKLDDEFMRRYSPERDLAEFEQAWSKRTTGDAAGPSYEPNYEGSSVVTGPPGALIGVDGGHSFTARPGHHLAPARLSSGRNVFEELGSGFTLLAFDAALNAAEPFALTAARLGVPLKTVRDNYEESRKEYGAKFILVRPDQYVAWTSNSAPSGDEELLQKVTGAD